MEFRRWLDPVVEAIDPRRRRTAVHGHRAHIEIRRPPPDRFDDFCASLRGELERADGVAAVHVNALLARAVVDFDPSRVGVERLVEAVSRAEETLPPDADGFRRDRFEYPGDAAPIARVGIELAADGAAFWTALVGRLVRAPLRPLQVDVLAAITALRGSPQLRGFLERVVGPELSDLGLTLAGAAAQGFAQAPVGPLVDICYRALFLAELLARRRAWLDREPELFGELPPDAPPEAPALRPVPLPAGPVERYSEQALYGSLGAFGVGVAATGSFAAATATLVGGSPRPAHVGRHAFAAWISRILASRGTLVLEPSSLRILDRIDVVVVDGRLASRGEPQVLDPNLEALRAVAARAGLAIRVSATEPWLRSALDADEVLEPGPAAIAELQRAGKVVCVVRSSAAGGDDGADLTIGIRRGGAIPWGVHVLCGDSLREAATFLEAASIAREVSSQGVTIAEVSAAMGLVLAIGGLRWETTTAVSRTLDLASLVSMLNGIRLGARHAALPTPPRHDRVPWHAMPVDDVLRRLDASRAGLGTDEAERRRGRVTAAPGAPAAALRYLAAGAEELANPLTPLLGVAASLSAAVGSLADAAMVGAVAAVDAVVGAAQRVRAEDAVEELVRRQPARVRVLRDGVDRICDASELVPGDVVRVQAGDLVPADCRILTASDLEADESSLTGESLPVPKDERPIDAADVAERRSMLYAGTSIAAGHARAVVTAVGDDTRAGAVAFRESEPPPSGVELRLRSLLSFTGPVAIASGAAVAASSLLRGRPLREVVGSAVGLAVAALPEGLPMIATMAQLASARRLSARGALIKNARVIEAMGRLDVVCLDKTGTLTEGRIQLTRVSDGARDEDLAPRAAPATDAAGAAGRVTPAALGRHGRDIVAVALRATPSPRPGRSLPHLTDVALRAGAELAGVGSGAEAGAGEGEPPWRPVAELPFESSRGYHAAIGRTRDRYELCVKGAPEVVLARCTSWRRDDETTDLDARVRDHLESEAHRLARQGLRVLAVAHRETETNGAPGDEHVRDLVFRGFVGLSDPVRATAPPAVAALGRAGVRVVMMTGDHPSTAERIAADLGLVAGDGVLTGSEIDALGDGELEARLASAVVIARLTPAHKARLVQAYQRIGHVVGMTGDGANDAPAIRLAHVGIAIGQRATAAARSAADVVITDERIETLVDAVLEGRAMWSSVRDAIALLVGGNLGEIAFILTAALASGSSPLNARQLLLVNVLTDALPALATAVRPPEFFSPEHLLAEGPEASLGRPLERDILWRAIATAGGTSAAWLAARATGREARAGTVAFATLVTSQLGQTLLTAGTSPMVALASAGSFLTAATIVQTPVLSQLFGCTPLGPVAWGIVLGASAAATGAAVLLPRALPGAADAILDLVRPPSPAAGPHGDRLRPSAAQAEPGSAPALRATEP